MSIDVDALEIALMVGRALDSVGVAYFVGGSLASSIQGEPRATNHIGFVVSLETAQVEPLRRALGDDFEVDGDALKNAIARRSSMNGFYLLAVPPKCRRS